MLTYQECEPTGEPLGNLESGLAASLTGSTRIAIVSGGLLCVAGAVAVAAALPLLWRYDARTRRVDAAGHRGGASAPLADAPSEVTG